MRTVVYQHFADTVNEYHKMGGEPFEKFQLLLRIS